ncbi:MAG TPA: flippase [Bacteroidales bacterium]|nr:flippase [Bacteroidales bacterium]HPS27089.1 flippase [Bacteroidales bacterium]
MFNKARNLIKEKDKKQVFSNFLSLSFMQAANYLIPLVAIPYLVRVLGDDRFGLVMFAQAFIQYFIILVDFGFELTATREISIHRNDRQKVTEIFSSVMYVKILLLLLGFLIMNIVVFSFDQFSQEWQLYYLSFGMVIGQLLFPVWFFQGIEKMKYIMFFNVLAKAIFTVLIFFIIFGPEDYKLYAVINSSGFIFAGLVAFIVALYMNRFGFTRPMKNPIRDIVKKTKDVFISNVGISLYMTSTSFILGLVTGRNDLVGFYTVAEKTIRGVRYVVSPVTQALYPYLSKRFAGQKREDSLPVLKKLMWYLTPVMLVLILGILIFTEKIVLLLTGSVNPSTVLDMRVISLILFLGTCNNVFGVLGMLNMGMEKLFRNNVLLSGLFNVILCIAGSHFLLDLGASVSVVATEFFLFLLIMRNFRKETRHA